MTTMNSFTNSSLMITDSSELQTISWTAMVFNLTLLEENEMDVKNSTDHPVTSLKVRVFRILLPMLIFIGITGNIVSFLVLSRARMRRTPTCLYLAALAILDTLVLLTGALRQAVLVLTPTRLDMAALSNANCKFMVWMFYTGTQAAAWIIVAMAIDRFVTVSNPLRMRRLPVTAITRGVICFIVSLFSITNIHFLVTGEVIVVSRRNEPLQMYCFTPNPDMQAFYIHVYPWLDASLYSYAPLTLLLIFNGFLMYKLFQRGQDFKSETPAGRPPTKSQTSAQDQSTRRISIVMMSVCLVYMMTTTPSGLVWAFNTRLEIEEEVASGILDFLMYINHACNFFIYCLTGARFRTELRLMLGCPKKSKIVRGNRGGPPASTATSITDLSQSVSTSTLQISVAAEPKPMSGEEDPKGVSTKENGDSTTGSFPGGDLT